MTGRLLVLVSAMTCLCAAAPLSQSRRVQIDGTTFRVTTKGDRVEVASKALIVVTSLALRDRMRRAVAEVTDCAISDELMIGNILTGKLDCASTRASK